MYSTAASTAIPRLNQTILYVSEYMPTLAFFDTVSIAAGTSLDYTNFILKYCLGV